MRTYLKNALIALSLGAMTSTAMPAAADPGNGKGHGRHDERHGGKHWDKHDDRDHGRHDDRGRGRDRHYAHDRGHDRHWDRGRDRDWDRRNDYDRHHDRYRHAPRRVVHAYDWNRPDPRYRGYYADRYYRGGYDPIRVTRHTRIYRGYDNRYYCRRSDGTTGLIVGATLGALLGNSLERGNSNVAATLIGGGVGAMLGREIDRGGLSCR